MERTTVVWHEGDIHTLLQKALIQSGYLDKGKVKKKILL
jgi:hypothetical protein